MTSIPHVLHLVDDATAGGVTGVVDFLCRSSQLAKTARHELMYVKRGKFSKLPKDVDIIVSHTAISWRALPALIALRAARPDTPLLHVEHSYTGAFVTHNVARKRRFMSLLRVSYSLFDQVIAVSTGQAKWMRNHSLCAADRLATIPSCVELERFRQLSAPAGPIRRFGAIGRLEPQKGFDLLIQAFRALPDPTLELHIIGEGAEKSRLLELAGDDARITFVGFTSDTTTAMAKLDAVVMPSRWEALGLVAREALAARRVLMCNDIDGLVDHEADGAVLTRMSDVRMLTAALSKIAQSHPAPVAAKHAWTPEDRFLSAWSNTVKKFHKRAAASCQQPPVLDHALT